MKKTAITLGLWACIAMGAFAAHTGKVFVDTNKNGIMDKGEKTLKGISVSDGLNVVQTGTDGSFSLPGHSKERFIFITTPSGYKSDNKHYRRIDSGNDVYEFGLQSYTQGIKKDGSHKFVHIADTEIFNTENHEDWVNGVRNYCANEQTAFIIHTGDICYENGLKNHIELMNTANMNCPMFYCIGNHDLVKGKYGEELFESLYGPVFYSFDAGNVHYIVTPMLGGDHAPSYKKADVYHWMKNDLALVPKDKAVMVFNHDLLTNGDEFIYGINDKEFINLNEHNLKAWIYGHWHINYVKKQGNVHAVSSATLDKGGIDHSTSSFRVMHVDNKGDFNSELRYTYIDKSIQIVSPADKQAPVLASGAVPLSVNIYNTSAPAKEVTYTCLVDGKTVASNKKLQKQTDWNWYAEVPFSSKQQDKAVTILVKAVFVNGETAQAEKSFTYQPGSQPNVKLGANWTNLLGNSTHTGAALTALNTPLSLAWVKNVGANIFMTSPIIANGKIYVASVDEDLKGDAHVYALDGTTGNICWKYKVRNSVKNTIVLESGFVFAQDVQGNLYAIDAETGKLGWEKKLSVNSLPALIEGLVATNGIIYAGTGKGLTASNAKTGETIWVNNEWNQAEGATTTLASDGYILIAGAQWSGLFASDASIGKLRWKIGRDGLSDRGASVAIHGKLVYVISRTSLFVLDVTSGKVIARKEIPFKVDVTSTPLLTDKEIIFGSSDSGLIALDNETFDVKWNFKTGESLVYTGPYSRKSSATIETSPVLSGNTVFVGASDGGIYGINKNDGQLVWQYNTGAPVFGTVAISGNALIAVDFSGNVYAFTSKEKEWEVTWEDNFDQDNVIDSKSWSKIPRGKSDWNNYMTDFDSCYAVKDGNLILTGMKNNSLKTDTATYLTGGIYTKDKVPFENGKIEIRAKLNGAKGAWPAIWLLPFGDENWPYGGEIDIMERLNHDTFAYQTVHSFYTYNLGIKNPATGSTGLINKDDYNIYAVELSPNYVSFSINGVPTLTYPRIKTDKEGQFPFDKPFYLLIDMQLEGSWVGGVDPNQLPVEMLVDWVKFSKEK